MVLATKSKKFKNSIITKPVCIILSALTFFTCCSSVLTYILAFDFCYGFNNFDNLLELTFFTEAKPDFFDCTNLHSLVCSNASVLDTYIGVDISKEKEKIFSKKEQYIEKVVNRYSLEKARIIEKELAFIADNYFREDESVYNLNGYSEAIYNSIPDVPANEQKYPIDTDAPQTVQMVQKILNHAKGTEFLKYSSLIRKDAFNEGEFIFNEYKYFFSMYNYTYTVESVRESAANNFDIYAENEYENIKSQYDHAKSQINNFINTIYYVKRGDVVYTNMKNPEQEIRNIELQECYVYKKDGKFVSQNVVDKNTFPYYNRGSDWNELLQACDTAAIYVNSEIEHGDNISELYEEYKNLPKKLDAVLYVALFSFVLFIICVCVLIISCGYKQGKEGVSLCFIDKVPTDIHLEVSAGLMFGVFALMVWIYQDLVSWNTVGIRTYSMLLTVGYLILIEWIISVIRLKKAKQSWLKNSFLFKIALWLFKWIKRLVSKISSFISRPLYSYKPQHLDKKLIWLVAGLFVVNFGLLFGSIPFFAVGPEFLGVLFILVSAALDISMLFYIKRYISMLDKIIVASTKRESAYFDGEKVPESLYTLNTSLKYTKEEMDKAIENAVKNERTKAELITNVSHDLKTPLTSMISYVELLKKCDIENEDALKYISVLSDKSQNLKSLIENLIEASKASSGNIKLNKVMLNFKELVAQAIAEFVADFEERGLELRFDETDEAINAMVDGQQTFRILENLLSNAKKYSATGTRVYASIRREENKAVFELKNISKAELNISPDELTERFVRGDASRGEEEGNGLGLSIAKQLCLLQDGELKLQIDGDLFKATVYLPIN